MKIYPKIRKFQSGGKLNEVNFYPTVQYTPTSNIAITQSAWSPLQQTRSKEALLDPELMKGKEMLTNEARAYMSGLESKMHEYNSLSEPERMSNRGQSLLAAMKGDTALAINLVNNKKRNDDTIKILGENDATGVWATNDKGEIASLDKTTGNIEWLDSAFLHGNLDRFTPRTAGELATDRGELASQVNKVGLDDIIRQSTGKKIWEENLNRTTSNIGHDQFKQVLQHNYGIDPSDGLLKSDKIGKGTLSNKYHIAAASDLAYNHMSQQDRRSIQATAVQDLFNPKNAENYIETPIEQIDASGKRNITYKREFFGDVLARLEGYSKDTNGNVIKKPVKPEEKFKILENFKQNFVKSYLRDYFDTRKIHETNFERTFDVASDDIYEKMGLGEKTLKATTYTRDAAAVEGAIKGLSQYETVVADTSDPTATVHTKAFIPLSHKDNEASTNLISFGKNGKALYKTFQNDPKSNYILPGGATFGGISIDKYSNEVKNTMFRINDGEATTGFFQTDGEGRIFNITGSTVDKANNQKMVTTLNNKMEEIKRKYTKVEKGKTYFDEKSADEEFNKWSDSQGITHTAALVFKTVALVPTKSTNSYDQRLIKDNSGYNTLSKEEHQILNNTLAVLNNNKNLFFDSLAPNNVKIVNGKPVVTITNAQGESEDFNVVVKTIVGPATELANIDAVATSDLEHKRELKRFGESQLLTDKQIKVLERLYSPNKGVNYYNSHTNVQSNEQGGIMPQFVPQEFKIKPLSLKDLY